ncbi:MAG: phage tail sheath subtilisin-like domain-containing protein [Acidobacteriota bacterium]
MLAPSTPGVRFEWADPRVLEGVRTDIAGFVGIAARGPVQQPVRVESWGQFTSIFGGHLSHAYLAYAVEGFFANGGRTCWVVRVADPLAATPAEVDLLDGQGRVGLRLEASSPGAWGRQISLRVGRQGRERFSLSVRLPTGESETWLDLTHAVASLDLVDAQGRPTLRLEAHDPRLLDHDVTVAVAPAGRGNTAFSLTLEPLPRDRAQDREGFEPLAAESFAELSMAPEHPRYAPNILTAGSSWITAIDLSSPDEYPYNLPAPLRPSHEARLGLLRHESRNVRRLLDEGSQLIKVRPAADGEKIPDRDSVPDPGSLPQGRTWLTGGSDGLETLSPAHLSGTGAPLEASWGLAALAAVDEVGLVAVPDIMPKPTVGAPARKLPEVDCHCLDEPAPEPPPLEPTEVAPHFSPVQIDVLQAALIQHCQTQGDRFALIDPLPDLVTPQQVSEWRRRFDSSYAALYFPWLDVPDPLRLAGLLHRVPPSGHMAGIYARGDRQEGVQRPPANQVVEGTRDLAMVIDDIDHGGLNTVGINVIRALPGRGLRVMGARTLSSDTSLRFVNVRRLLILIREVLDQGLQWSVLEPNGPALWEAIERVTESTLDRLWRQGALDGSNRDEAYFARCNEVTNPPEEVEAGRLICEIGVLLPPPAEFVVVRIGRSEAGVEILQVTEEARRG